VIGALANLARTDASKDQIASGGGIERILSALRIHGKHIQVKEEAHRALLKLEHTDVLTRLLAESYVVRKANDIGSVLLAAKVHLVPTSVRVCT